MTTKRTTRRSSSKSRPRSGGSKIQFDVRYVPDFVLRQISGAKGDKKSGRPELFSVRTYKVHTKEDGVIVNTYLVFGGVPPKSLHNKLTDLGFKVRRRPFSWTDKDSNIHEVGENDRECYAVYYNTEPQVTEEQAEYIGGLYAKVSKFVTESGSTFLLPTWDAVDTNWGNRDEWIQICTVPEEDTPAAASDEDDETPGVDLTALDDMF